MVGPPSRMNGVELLLRTRVGRWVQPGGAIMGLVVSWIPEIWTPFWVQGWGLCPGLRRSGNLLVSRGRSHVLNCRGQGSCPGLRGRYLYPGPRGRVIVQR